MGGGNNADTLWWTKVEKRCIKRKKCSEWFSQVFYKNFFFKKTEKLELAQKLNFTGFNLNFIVYKWFLLILIRWVDQTQFKYCAFASYFRFYIFFLLINKLFFLAQKEKRKKLFFLAQKEKEKKEQKLKQTIA